MSDFRESVLPGLRCETPPPPPPPRFFSLPPTANPTDPWADRIPTEEEDAISDVEVLQTTAPAAGDVVVLSRDCVEGGTLDPMRSSFPTTHMKPMLRFLELWYNELRIRCVIRITITDMRALVRQILRPFCYGSLGVTCEEFRVLNLPYARISIRSLWDMMNAIIHRSRVSYI